MTSAYTPLLGLVLPVTGELSGTWGAVWNDSGTSLIDAAIAGTTTLSTDADVTLTTTTGAANTSREAILLFSGARTVLRTVTAPAASKIYTVINATTGGFGVKVVGAGPTTGVTIVAGESAVIAWNGSDFIKISNTSGAGVFTSVTDSGLTTGRVTYATTGGLLTDSANLLFNGTTLTANTLNLTNALTTAYGGTGLTSFTAGDLPYYAAGTVLSKLAIGTAGQILTSSGTAPQWSTLSGVAVTTFSAGTTGFTPSTATSGAITLSGTLATTNGGTGLSSFTANGVVYASSTSALATGSALTFDGSNLVGTGKFQSQVMRIKDASFSDLYFSTGDTGGNGVISYNQSANAMVFYSSGSEGMRLTSTGLGIGSSSPDRALTVYTTDSSGKIALFSNGSINTNVYISADPASGSGVINVSNNAATAAFPLMFQMNGTERMRLDTAGNLGLGVTPSAWGGSYKAFQLTNTGRSLAATGAGAGDLTLVFNAIYDSTDSRWEYADTGDAAVRYSQTGAGIHAWYTAPSGTAGNAISFTQAMTLAASGNLGLGETSPANLLSLKYSATDYGASILVNNTSAGAGSTSSIRFVNASSSTGLVIGKHASGFTESNIAYINQETNAPLAFFTNSTERMRLDASGNLMVGTTTVGVTNTKSIVADLGAEGYLIVNHSGSASGSGYQYFGYNGGVIGSITQAGTTGVLYNVTSDYRLKDIAGPVTASGAFIDSLKPVQGSWKADGSRFIGFLAHELQEASETVVGSGVKDGEEMQSIDYSNAELIANLVAELQSLRKRLAAAGI